MRLAKPDRDDPHYEDTSIQCLICGKMFPYKHATIDLDGPAFKAYFCSDRCLGSWREAEEIDPESLRAAEALHDRLISGRLAK